MRSLNPRRVKKHRSYSVDEAARLLGVSRNTVREWIKRGGLATCDGCRPFLILGPDLAAFLTARRRTRKRPCQPDEMFCLRCRKARTPAGRMADVHQRTDKIATLVGICPDCGTFMHRAVNAAGLAKISTFLDVRPTMGRADIVESAIPIVNRDLRADVQQ